MRVIESVRLDHIWTMPAVIGAALAASEVGRSRHDQESADGIEVARIPPLDGSAVAEDDFVVVRMVWWQPVMMRLRQRSRRSRHTEDYAGGTRAND
jgi:hypothetical protein